MNKEKPNEQIELARQSGYNEAMFICEQRVKKLKEEFEQIDIIDSCIIERIIDKIFGFCTTKVSIKPSKQNSIVDKEVYKPLTEKAFFLEYNTMRYLLGSKLLFFDDYVKAIKDLKEFLCDKLGCYDFKEIDKIMGEQDVDKR